jgi:formylglycine-generating enzyme required for sulfatase activity
VEVAKKVAQDAEKKHQEMLAKKQQADVAASEAKKTLEDRTAASASILKAADEIATLKAKREEEMQAANLAAEEAKKVAEEKVRLADEAKKAVANVEKDGKERFAARLKVEAELKQLQEAVAQKERISVEAQKSVEAALAKRDEERAAVEKAEEQLARAKTAAEEAEKMALARRKEQEEKRAAIRKEIEDAKRQFEERMKALEAALQSPDGAASSPAAKSPADSAPAPTKKSEPAPPPAKSEPEAVSAVPPRPSANEVAKVAGSEPTILAKAETKPIPVPAIEGEPAPSREMTNSLGMRFVPVGDLLFAVWPTRVSDFEAFASATGLKSTVWREPGFRQNPDHPVVNVTWMEAAAFCKWLTFKEQREGSLPADKIYRLPTDLEWSKAVGLPEETGRTPKARDMGVLDVYPWGTQWPPPPGAGNYTGEETGSEVAIRGYNDGFPWTAPVGSFQPNKYGLYDMGGNVWQWVNDVWSSDSKSKVLRGASWYNGAIKLSLLSSCRVAAAPESSTDNYGFRCVIATESKR